MAANCDKRLSIIIPSFNDARIMRAIDSVRAFDNASAVSVVVVDGGSKADLVDRIRKRLTTEDVLINEPDKGIFDALNKGLAATKTEYIGWIGSDDYLSGEVKAAEVIDHLEVCDLFVGDTAIVSDGTIMRVTHSWPSRYALARFGLHNPHFSTFGRSELLKRERFSLELRGSDIDYFLRIFRHRPTVHVTPKIVTYQEEGGFSNSSYRAILKTNRELYGVYRSYMSAPLAAFALAVKLGYKLSSAALFKLGVARRR